jgi:hypothetical protein
MLGTQSDFLAQFPEHRLFGGFTALDSALGKLPSVFPNSFAPEDFVDPIDQDDTDVGAVAVSIQHTATLNSCHKFEMIIATVSAKDTPNR